MNSFAYWSDPERRQLATELAVEREPDPTAGHRLVASQITRRLADAQDYAVELRTAVNAGNEAAIQHAAAAIHTHCQTAQVLARMLEKDTAEHRRRTGRVR